jgi:thermitase
MRRLALAGVLLLCAAAPASAADPLRPRQWGLDMIEVDAARATSNGAGALVAVIDTGAQLDHPDLAGRLVAGRDFVQDDDAPQDGDGHGTHVSGIVSATSGNGVGVESVAPGARVLVIRVLGSDGSGSAEDVADGIDHAVARGAQVINLSLGSGTAVFGTDPDFDAAIDRALDRGVVVVAASGNTGVPVCEQPSGQGRLLCVGAVDQRGSRAVYSSFGFGLGISAPGGSGLPFDTDILSTYPPSGYAEVAGTSQASPHVAAVAALLVSLGLRGQAVTERILATARDAGPSGPDDEYGAGIVNARAAVAGLRTGGGGSAGPTAVAARPGSAARISVPRYQRLRDVLRRGIRFTCRTAGRGRCKGIARLGTRRVASASRAVRPGVTVTVRLPLNARGRALARRGRRFTVRVTITAPGMRPQFRRVTLTR